MDDKEERLAIRNVIACLFGERANLSIEDARRALLADGEMFIDRNALSIKLIRQYCDRHLSEDGHDWLQHMRPTSSNPVTGFAEDELWQYADPNVAARRFVIENVYEVLFPDRKGVFT